MKHSIRYALILSVIALAVGTLILKQGEAFIAGYDAGRTDDAPTTTLTPVSLPTTPDCWHQRTPDGPIRVCGDWYSADRDLVIHEDEDDWDCHTMGNRICGPARQP